MSCPSCCPSRTNQCILPSVISSMFVLFSVSCHSCVEARRSGGGSSSSAWGEPWPTGESLYTCLFLQYHMRRFQNHGQFLKKTQSLLCHFVVSEMSKHKNYMHTNFLLFSWIFHKVWYEILLCSLELNLKGYFNGKPLHSLP